MSEKSGNRRFPGYYESDMDLKVTLTFKSKDDKQRFLNWWTSGKENL